MACNASLSTALSVLPNKSHSWLFYSSCCNHITPHLSLFFKLELAPLPLSIRIANGSTMHGNSLGFVSTSNLSVPGVFHVPKLSYNLLSVGQLAKLDYRLIFIILAVLCMIQGWDRSLRLVLELGVCFPWTTFIFHLLLLFLILL